MSEIEFITKEEVLLELYPELVWTIEHGFLKAQIHEHPMTELELGESC
jgi:hypothetical protein